MNSLNSKYLFNLWLPECFYSNISYCWVGASCCFNPMQSGLGILFNVGKPLSQDSTFPGAHSTYNINTRKYTYYSNSVNNTLSFQWAVFVVRGVLSLKNCCHDLGVNLGHPITSGSWILCFSSRPPAPPNNSDASECSVLDMFLFTSSGSSCSWKGLSHYCGCWRTAIPLWGKK